MFIHLLLAFSVTTVLTFWLISNKTPFSILDTPNDRSLHSFPTPRTGGIGIVLGIFVSWLLYAYTLDKLEVIPWILCAMVLIAGVSFIDDYKGLSPLFRFIVHGCAAGIIISGGLVLPWGIVGVVLTWLSIVWMINLYNFMDGMDGFAAGMSICGFGVLGLAGWFDGNVAFAYYNWLIVFATSGFLLFNFPPARIFMGDMGSVTLGLLAASCSFWGICLEIFPVWFPLMVFSPFIVDATVTLLRRVVCRQKVWEAHRSHYYQRLVQFGWGHRKTVLLEYFLMVAVGVSSLFLLRQTLLYQLIGITIWTLIYCFLCLSVHFSKTMPA